MALPISPEKIIRWLILGTFCFTFLTTTGQSQWSSRLVFYGEGGKLQYLPENSGDIIPDFSHVGYHYGDDTIPNVPVVVELSPSGGDDGAAIQAAIKSLSSSVPDQNGYRGAILLKKGIYKIAGSVLVNVSGVVLRGEGDDDAGTTIIATGTGDRNLINVGASASLQLNQSTKTRIKESYIPLGRKFVVVDNPAYFKKGDLIAIHRPGTDQWIKDIRMNQISGADATQWTASGYNFNFERIITDIRKDTLFFRNPVVMAMEDKYGGGFVMKCSMNRLNHIGIENIQFKSEYKSDTDEAHSWNAIWFYNVEHSWVRKVTSRYFAYSCVTVGRAAKHITVIDSKCLSPKSVITGSRRYSFNLEGQLSLFKNCQTSEGRHDFVTSSRVCGPNVFTQCTAVKPYADAGPHHRWAMGTLFDEIVTDGEINVQDRDNSGSGHGWSGVNQVFWNCRGAASICQSPWASGKNYNIGFQGAKKPGQWQTNRPDGVWEGHNVKGLFPSSLYEAQIADRKTDIRIFSVYSSLGQVNDSTFILTFNMDADSTDMTVKSNYSLSGTSVAKDKEWKITVLDKRRVSFTFNNLGVIPFASTVIIDAAGVKPSQGDTLAGLKQAAFSEPDKRPVVTVKYQETNNGEESFAVAQSSKTGRIYLVKMGMPAGTTADLDAAVNGMNGAVEPVDLAGDSVKISTRGLNTGLYYVYAVDEAGRISARSVNTVYVRLYTAAGSDIQNRQEEWIIYSARSVLFIQPHGQPAPVFHLDVFDTNGRMLVRKKEQRGNQQISIPRGEKILLVRISHENAVFTRKIPVYY